MSRALIRNDKKTSKLLILTLILFFSFFVFLIDYLAPIGIAVGVLYCLPTIFACFIFKDNKLTQKLVLVFSIAVTIGYLLSSSNEFRVFAAINRALSVLTIFFTGLIGAMLVRALERSERLDQLSRDTLEASPSAMILTNRSGKIILANRKIEKIFGYIREEIVGSEVEMLVPRDVAKRHPDLRAKFFNAPHSREMGRGRDLYGRKKNGALVSVEIGLTPVKTIEGDCVVSSIVDVSKRKATEDALRESKIALESKNKEMEQFFYMVSHDLSSPVVTLKGLAGLLREDIKKERWGEVEKSVKGIGKSASLISDLLGDILEIIRIGRIPLNPESVSLNEMICQIRDAHMLELEENKINFVMEAQGDARIFADRSRLFQMLDNLASNAIKHGACGDGSKVVMGHECQGNECLIYVKDNGPGIPAKYHKKIFELFGRVERKKSGTGAGLFIAKRIVQLNQGRIWLDSKLGQGTTFWISLPTTIPIKGNDVAS